MYFISVYQCFLVYQCLTENLRFIKSRLKADRKSVTQKWKCNENPKLKMFKTKMSKHLRVDSNICIFQKESEKDTVSLSKFVKFIKAESFKRQYATGHTSCA